MFEGGRRSRNTIDGEAGIEQVNRRVMETVTQLLLVSDLSKKGLNVAETIAAVADKAMHCEKKGLIINRVKPTDDIDSSVGTHLELYGRLPEDDQIRLADMKGESLLSLENSTAYQELTRIADLLI